MAIDAWHRTKAVLAEALERRPDERAAYLDEACAGDQALRAEVESLLDADGAGAGTITTFGRAMTPDYASPEQVRGDAITPATDVHALGLLLYELLTGHRPFRLGTRSPDEIAQVVCEQDPERPSAVVGRTDTTTSADGTTTSTTPDSGIPFSLMKRARRSSSAARRCGRSMNNTRNGSRSWKVLSARSISFAPAT